MVGGGYCSKPYSSYIPQILATEKFESTKYFFMNQLIWTSSIFINMSYLSYKLVISTEAEKKKRKKEKANKHSNSTDFFS